MSSAAEAASSDGALDGQMNETPEVSMADADLEGVRLSAIDDQVSPIKKESRSGGDDSGASSNSALNLDITGPGGDGRGIRRKRPRRRRQRPPRWQPARLALERLILKWKIRPQYRFPLQMNPLTIEDQGLRPHQTFMKTGAT